jgi:hypothetical protein
MSANLEQPIGVTMGWSLAPQLAFKGGLCYFSRDCDYTFFPEYFPDGERTWPKWPDGPHKGEKLPIADFHKHTSKREPRWEIIFWIWCVGIGTLLLGLLIYLYSR